MTDKVPRLNFVGNNELLAALTNADSPMTARYIVGACFPNIIDITVEPRMDEQDRKCPGNIAMRCPYMGIIVL